VRDLPDQGSDILVRFFHEVIHRAADHAPGLDCSRIEGLLVHGSVKIIARVRAVQRVRAADKELHLLLGHRLIGRKNARLRARDKPRVKDGLQLRLRPCRDICKAAGRKRHARVLAHGLRKRSEGAGEHDQRLGARDGVLLSERSVLVAFEDIAFLHAGVVVVRRLQQHLRHLRARRFRRERGRQQCNQHHRRQETREPSFHFHVVSSFHTRID